VAEGERRLSVVDEILTVVAANLQRGDRLRQSILQRAFAGQLVSQDPNDEPAEELLERIKAERRERQVRNSPIIKLTKQTTLGYE
jgi:type I restriction enzyme, S subunit